MLSFEAVATWMRWRKVPIAWRPRTWEGVQLLHDLRRHPDRFDELHPGLCYHADRPLRLVDARHERVHPDGRRLPNCIRCAARWRCEACDELFVLHENC